MKGRKAGSGKPRQRKNVKGELIDTWEVMVSINNKSGETKRIPIYGSTYEECEQNKLAFLASLPLDETKEDRIIPKVNEAAEFLNKGQTVILKDSLRHVRRPHIIDEKGFTLCGCNTDYYGANVFWSREYRGSASKCTCKKCLGVFINTLSHEQLKSYTYSKEDYKMSIERKPVEDTPRFEKLKETADLLEVGYEEFINNFNKPEVQALTVLTKVNISPSAEYIEILKNLPYTIRKLSNELEETDKINIYKNMADEVFKLAIHYSKTLSKGEAK